MSVLPDRVRRRVLLRSFLVQGSWNYETLIGTGFAFTLLPVLRYLHPADPERRLVLMRRHAGIFNSHPYLANVAVGAVSRLEAEGADPAVTERFKSALRGALGSIGDRLVWTAWRPAAILVAIVLLLLGAPWWLGLIAFLAIYNALHLALRAWSLRVGLDNGLEVARVLRDAPLERLASRAADAGAFLCGVAVVLAIAQSAPTTTDLGLGVAAAIAGIALGARSRSVIAPAVGLLWIFAILLGLMP
jgi:mannose PTS system EIID component